MFFPPYKQKICVTLKETQRERTGPVFPELVVSKKEKKFFSPPGCLSMVLFPRRHTLSGATVRGTITSLHSCTMVPFPKFRVHDPDLPACKNRQPFLNTYICTKTSSSQISLHSPWPDPKPSSAWEEWVSPFYPIS